MRAAYELLIAAVGAAGCWTLWFYLYKEYRASAVREDLFALRGELFLFAADGAIAFDDPSYKELRQRLNAMIRFAHRINLLTLIFATRSARHNPGRDVSYAEWLESLRRLPQDTQEKMEQFHKRMLFRFTEHLISGSVSLMLLLVLVQTTIIVRSWMRHFFAAKAVVVDPTDRAISELVDTLHVSTLEKSACEEHYSSDDLDLQLV